MHRDFDQNGGAKKRAKSQFRDRLIKAVVDIEKRVMAIGGAMHCDEESVLLEKGSSQWNLWGINIYPEKMGEEFIEYNSMTPKWRVLGRLREITRAKELFCAAVLGSNEYNTTLEDLDKYFLFYACIARENR